MEFDWVNLESKVKKYFFQLDIDITTNETVIESIEHQIFIENIRLSIESKDINKLGKTILFHHNKNITDSKITQLLNSKDEDLKNLRQYYECILMTILC